jgi:hypothetical protein
VNVGAFTRLALAVALVQLGVLASVYSVLIFVSIPRSDTATDALVLFGLQFALSGLAAVGAGAWLLGRARVSK